MSDSDLTTLLEQLQRNPETKSQFDALRALVAQAADLDTERRLANKPIRSDPDLQFENDASARLALAKLQSLNAIESEEFKLQRRAQKLGLSETFKAIHELIGRSEEDPQAAARLAEIYPALDLEANKLPPTLAPDQAKTAPKSLIGDVEASAASTSATASEPSPAVRNRDDDEQKETAGPATAPPPSGKRDSTRGKSQTSAEQALNEHENDNGLVDEDPFANVDRRDPRAMPDHILHRLHRDGNRYRDPENDGRVVFLDRGDRLNTTRNFDATTIHMMIDVAEARGWHKLRLTGTPEFRRAAWFEAASRGIETTGYKPTNAELVSAHKAFEQRGVPNEVENDPRQRGVSSRGRSTHSEQDDRGHDDPPGAGRLVEHGKAPYQFDKKNKPSYYATLQTSRGEKTVWGVDLERAISESGAAKGDLITATSVGRQEVTVTDAVRDEQGKVTGYRDIKTHRNAWEVELLENEQSKAFAAARNPQDRQRAATDNPQLANAFATEAALKKFAEARLPEAAREPFMERQRSNITNDLAQGVALPDVEVFEASEKERTRTRQKDREHSSER